MMNNEQGRSMVEMLGVLAIIGVLSVAGITGYTMAMRKYRANEIVNAASQMVVLAMAQRDASGGNQDGKASTSGYGITIPGASNIEATCAANGDCTVDVSYENDSDGTLQAVVEGMVPSGSTYSFGTSGT